VRFAIPAMCALGKEQTVMSGDKVTKATLQQRIRGLIAGAQKHTPNGSLTLGSATYTVPALVQLVKSLADALDAADAAKASWQDALKNATDTKAKVGPVVRDYQSWVAVTYRGTPSTLADYGVTPRKAPTPLTAQQKATAALKRKATRTARHTMSKKQKKNVKGAAPAATPVASTTASTPVVGPSPAASAPSQGTGAVAAPRIP
jgi:hypothetical protein